MRACAAVAAWLLAGVLPGVSEARDLFSAGISIDGASATKVGSNRMRDIPDFFKASTLQGIDGSYDPFSDSVAATLNLRGMKAIVSYAPASTALRLRVTGTDIDVTFDGGSRDDSLDRFEDWLQGDFEEGLLTDFLQALVSESPVDPVAGNPNSLQSKMFSQDFRVGTGSMATSAEGGLNIFKVDLLGGYADADGFDVYSIDLPIQFSFGFDRFALLFDLPLSATTTNGAWSGMFAPGLGVRVKPMHWWSITPAVRFGGVGSIDVGALALMYTGSVTNHMRFPAGPLRVGMMNMLGFSNTVDGVEVGGYEFSYELMNGVTRNGAYVEGQLGEDRIGLGWRLYGSGVSYWGDDLYMDHYGELGGALGTAALLAGLNLDLAYTIGRNYDGVTARLGLRF